MYSLNGSTTGERAAGTQATVVSPQRNSESPPRGPPGRRRGLGSGGQRGSVGAGSLHSLLFIPLSLALLLTASRATTSWSNLVSDLRVKKPVRVRLHSRQNCTPRAGPAVPAAERNGIFRSEPAPSHPLRRGPRSARRPPVSQRTLTALARLPRTYRIITTH